MSATQMSFTEIIIYVVIAVFVITVPLFLWGLNSRITANIEDNEVKMAAYVISEILLNMDENGAASTTRPECIRTFSEHKAVDISASCGTPVKALCDGFIESTYGLGMTQKELNYGVVLSKLKNCDGYSSSPDERIFYSCIFASDTSSRNVAKGDTIGFISTCAPEEAQGCHLHFQLVKGAIDKQKDSDFVCDKLDFILQKATDSLEGESLSRDGGFFIGGLNKLDGTSMEPVWHCYAYHVTVTSPVKIGEKKIWEFGYKGGDEAFAAEFPVYIRADKIYPANFRLDVYDTEKKRCPD